MILLLNPNSNGATTDTMVAIARTAVPGLRIEGRTAPFGPRMITEPEALARSAEAVAIMADQAGPEVEGIIIAAFGDPGLDDLAARLSIPVTGIGEAAFAEASAHGRFGIATTTPELETAIAARVWAGGHTAQFTGCRFTQGDPHRLTADPAALTEALAQAIEACITDGAQSVIIGGGPLATAAQDLAPRFGIPIIQPVPAAARRMAALL